jgi:hypothetical protein
MRKTCSTRKSSVLTTTTSAKVFPVRHASTRHRTLCGERLFSTALLSDCTIVSSACPIERRIAGAMIGKSASARIFGFSSTDRRIVRSVTGVIAFTRPSST